MSRNSPKEIERCKRIAATMTPMNLAQGSLAPVTGYAATVAKMKAELNERRLDEIAAMLTDAGVPIWVENNCHRGVPSCSPVSRLKWYLARRKNVAAHEIDQKLQREMKEAEIHAREYMGRYNADISHREQ